ncbi:hypothetical protein CapIbe_012414 [Capra ibex]
MTQWEDLEAYKYRASHAISRAAGETVLNSHLGEEPTVNWLIMTRSSSLCYISWLSTQLHPSRLQFVGRQLSSPNENKGREEVKGKGETSGCVSGVALIKRNLWIKRFCYAFPKTLKALTQDTTQLHNASLL